MRNWAFAALWATFVCGVIACGSGGSTGVATFDATAGDDAGGFDAASIGIGVGTADSGNGTGACVPKTCADLGASCGPQGDGCGGIVDGGCGTCSAGAICGGGGPDAGTHCLGGCEPKTCAQQGIACGPAGDGCGNTLNCYPDDAGACPPGETCGGGGAFQCGTGAIPDGGGIVDASSCVPKTCATGQCGPTTDGCGHTLDCGGCGDAGTCGFPTAFFCGYPPDGGTSFCTPKTCAQQGIGCGQAGDGCGNILNCWPDGGTSCGPGGTCGLTTPGQCGYISSDAAASACVPSKSCAGLNCGYVDDGCGNVLDCWPSGTTSCTGLNSCGGGGTSNVCGGSPVPDGGTSLCQPLTCAQQGISCGSAGDGCGHTLNCYPSGTTACASGGTCETVDGGAVTCVPPTSVCSPTTCAAQGISCGSAGDGCGNLLNCYPNNGSSCGDGGLCETVDGGAVTCINPVASCTKTTCAAQNANCGYVSDGCGGLLNCNPNDAGCAAPDFCGGGGPNECGIGYSAPDGGTYVSCSGGAVTSITGIAYAATDPTVFNAAETPDPLSGAYVWVPQSGTLPPITPGISCDVCANPANALAVTTTGPDGSFSLPNVPVVATSGQATVPIIVQVGRWARLQTFNVTPCQPNSTPPYTANKDVHLRLPRTSTEGNLPWFAVDTGTIDQLECILLKMGVASGEFQAASTVQSDMTSGPNGTPAPGGSRVAIYTSPDTSTGGAAGGALDPNGGNTSGQTLYGTPATLDTYDAVLFPCVADAVNKTFAGQAQNVADYTNKGGRAFFTHFSYTWLYDLFTDVPTGTAAAPYAWGCNSTCATTGKHSKGCSGACDTTGDTVGQWDPDEEEFGSNINVNIDTTTTSGVTFAQWMVNLGQTSTPAQGSTVTSKENVQFTAEAARWDLDSVLPVATQWAYTTAGGGNSVQQMSFNTPVNAAAAKQCGKVVFSDFHVVNAGNGGYSQGMNFPTECTDNNGTTVTGHLNPMSAQERALEYQVFNLTSCVSTGSGGTCTPKTCASYPTGTCGEQSDGCGGFISCTCPTGQTCGAGGSATQCGACQPRTCAYYGTGACGEQSDGCGGTLNCATCPSGETCGGGGVANKCGACVPKTCSNYPGECGQQADGCGGLTSYCNPCPTGQSCGGAGVANQCGVPDAGVCAPIGCSAYPAGTCGQQSNGCGSLTTNCGTCGAGQSCGAGGVANQCGSPDAGTCVPKTCSAYPTVCGQQSDGCGSLTSVCNPCPSGQTCGGAGTPGVCGTGACTPTTCAAQNLSCGPAGDGCGGSLDCGPCPSGQTCGGGGVQGACGGCTPETCSSPGVGCGTNGDGCGGTLNCTCPTGETCGGGGTPGVCGSVSCTPETCTGLNLQCGYESDGCGNLLNCGTCGGGATCTNGTCQGGTGPR